MNSLPIARLADSVRDHRSASAVGREARLELVFERRGARTVVAHAYAEPPFRIGRTFEIGDAAYVIVVCSGPGIFAGDVLHQSIQVGRGARAVLTSQSALQIHPAAAQSPAVIRHRYDVDEDAELHCQWDPVIPFADARLDERFDLRLAESSRMYWSDALMSGRVSRGETWRFQSLAHELRVRVGASLVYLERYCLTPRERAVGSTWIAADAHYMATALVHHPRATTESAEALHRVFAELGGGRAAVDLVATRIAVARFMGADGASFARARASYRTLAVQSIFGGPEPVMRK